MLQWIKNFLFPKDSLSSIRTQPRKTPLNSTATTVTTQPTLKDYSFEAMQNFEMRSSSNNSPIQYTDPKKYQWIRSIDYSGYIREEALNYIIKNYEKGDENRILLRLSDWVPKIQKIAEKWVLEYFSSINFEDIALNLKLIAYLARKENLKDNPALLHIHEVLLEKIKTYDSKELHQLESIHRRYLYILSLHQDQFLRPYILQDKDPFNRSLLFHSSFDLILTHQESQTLSQDKSAIIRLQYLRIQSQNNQVPNKDLVLKSLCDTNRGLRVLAQFLLKKHFQENAYDYYKQRQNDSRYFLADYQKRDDLDLFLEGLRSSDKTTRSNCLAAILDLDALSLKPQELLPLLTERKCRTLLSPILPQLISTEELVALKLHFEVIPNGIILFFKVLSYQSIWLFLLHYLREIRNHSRPELEAWFTNSHHRIFSSYEKIPDARKQEILEELERPDCRILDKSEFIFVLKQKQIVLQDVD